MKPSTEQQDRIIAFIKGGAKPETAAEVCGLSPEDYELWLSDLTVLKRIDTALAEARLLAEIKLKDRAPGTWLNERKQRSSKPARKLDTAKVEKAKPKEKKLTLRQEKFVHEYVANNGNAMQAAIAAGYAKTTATAETKRLLENVGISRAIEVLRNKIFQRTDITPERVLREYAAIGFSDLAQCYDEDGNLLPIKEMPEMARRAIAGIEEETLFDFVQGEGRTAIGKLRKIKIAPKSQALDALAKHLGLWKDRLELTGKDGAPLTLDVLRKAFETDAGQAQ